jgi:hypothetical protein
MPGLDPRIHDESPREEPYVNLFLQRCLMDCRVKPGNDTSGNGTPAKAAGMTDKLWEMSDLVKVLEDWEART